MTTKTQEELDQMRDEIAAGRLPRDAIKNYLAEEEKVVFGADFKKVKGQPVEVGFGAPGHETQNHFNAIRKYEGEEAHKKAVAEAEARKKRG